MADNTRYQRRNYSLICQELSKPQYEALFAANHTLLEAMLSRAFGVDTAEARNWVARVRQNAKYHDKPLLDYIQNYRPPQRPTTVKKARHCRMITAGKRRADKMLISDDLHEELDGRRLSLEELAMPIVIKVNSSATTKKRQAEAGEAEDQMAMHDDDNEDDCEWEEEYLIPNIPTATVTGPMITTRRRTWTCKSSTDTPTKISRPATSNSKLVFPIHNDVELCMLGTEQDERPVETFATLIRVVAVAWAKKGTVIKLKGSKLLKKTINLFFTNEFLSTCVWASPMPGKPNAISYHKSALKALYKAHKHFDQTYELSDFEKQMRRFVSKTRVKKVVVVEEEKQD